jgi:hypothetical protein
MKDKHVVRTRIPKRASARSHTSSKEKVPIDALESRAARVITSFVRVLLLLGFDSAFISQEVRRATQSEKVRPMKRLEFDVREMGRILDRWVNDPQFVSDQGRPLDLPQRGAKISFESLVNAELPGINPNACLDMLMSSEVVVRSQRGLLRLRNRIVQRLAGDTVAVEDSLRPLQGLLDTLAQNMMSSATGKGVRVLECGVSGFQVGPSDVSDLCHHALRHGTLLLEQLDEWLALRERRRPHDNSAGPALRPYVGLFIARDAGA